MGHWRRCQRSQKLGSRRASAANSSAQASSRSCTDGSLQGYSGAVTEGCHDQPELTGIQIWPQATIDTVVEQALISGWQVGTHGNGDRAIDSILDAYERALERHPIADHRLRIEHCQTVREDQLDRMARLGVSASFFNVHVY